MGEEACVKTYSLLYGKPVLVLCLCTRRRPHSAGTRRHLSTFGLACSDELFIRVRCMLLHSCAVRSESWESQLNTQLQTGPLFLSPLSELYGRRSVLTAANVIFVLFQVACALAPSMPALIAFRTLAGIGGSACLTTGGGVVADLFTAEQRGLAMSVFTFGPLFGPVLGPICGGFIAGRAGWRWVRTQTKACWFVYPCF
jgi:multidrug resistance protein